MSIVGMNEFERQILTNQAVIMGFLHGAFLDKISYLNQSAYDGLYSCFRETKDMLERDLGGDGDV